MKEIKRVLSLILCFVMVVGMMPVFVLNADAATGALVDAAIFCSDVHGKPDTVASVFGGIKNADSTFNPSTASFVGDTQCAASSVTSAAQGVFSDVKCYYAFGNHDDEGNYGIADVTGLVYGDSSTNYYIYAISENSMASSDPDTTDFTDTVAGLDQSKPLFIISHLPLHSRRGDSNGAAVWYPAISAAAEKMDIFFFWAHNHTGEGDADIAAYYVAKNGSETITLEDTNTVVTPNFTYANAGYIDPTNIPARNNVATAVRIYEDSVNLTVYNASGVLSGEYAVNETVTRQFASTSGSGDSGSTEETTAPTVEKEVYVLVDTMTVGKDYLIANGNSGSVTILGQSGGSSVTTSATVVTEGDYTYIETADSGYIWNATAHPNSSYSSYPRLINGETHAMYANNGSLAFSSSLTNTSGAVYTRYWTYTDGVLACVSTNSGSTTYYMNSSFALSSSSSTGIYIYEKQTINVSGDGSGDSGDDNTGSGDSGNTGDSTETVVGDATVNTADNGSWQTVTVGSSKTETKTKTVYVLSSGNPSGDVLIADANTAGTVHLVANDGGDLSNTTSTVIYGDCDGDGDSEYYIELTDTEATNSLWTVSTGYKFENQGEYLRYNDGLSVSSTSTTWSYSSNRLSYEGSRNTYYLRYNSGWTTTSKSSSATSIYFYTPTEVEYEETIDSSTTYSVTASDVEYFLDESLTASIEATTNKDANATFTYEVVGGDDIITSIDADGTILFNGTEGTAQVKVSYEWTDGENDYIIWKTIDVKATKPYYTVELHKAEEDGSLTLIEAPVALKGIEAGDTYSVWAVIKEYDGVIEDGEDGADLGDVADDRLYWTVSDPSIATIDPASGEIIFTGNNYGTFEVTVHYLDENGGSLCSDTIIISATESQYVVPGDGTDDFPEYPDQGAIRFDKTAVAQGNFSQTGIAKVELSMTGVPYGTSTKTDVVVMVDMTASMSDDDVTAAELAVQELIESLVYDEENDKYDSNIQLFIDVFYSASSDSAFETEEYLNCVTISNAEELAAAKAKIDFTQSSNGGGTRYNLAMKDVYDTLNRDGHADNQYVVFVSDGVPTAYAPLTNGTLGTTITGSNSTTSSLADGWFDLTTGAVTSSFQTEYYSYLIKTAGISVYTVGCNLTALTEPALVLDHMSSNYSADGKTATGETKYSFFCTTSGGITDEVLEIFHNIGQGIREAATNVVVEDKIDSHYTLNFSLPENVTATEAEMDAFYIQALGYELDENNDRKENPTVLEKFLFNADGTIVHTIGSTTCDSCTHVTKSNGTVTGIDGTYFDYTVNAKGEEFLTWVADKLDRTELALEYFVYLDHSAGEVAADQVDPGTYPTNEYATITYTNFNGKECQQYYPIPTMTWMGAQVTYVFYLVNTNGQPVNRAGKIIPFAESIYVTDPVTIDVTWNELEGSENMLAENLLALAKVPDVYSLYDSEAYYEIRVYQTEGVDSESQAKNYNYFIIEGSDSIANKETTKVFNTKAGNRYDDYGAYSATAGSYISHNSNEPYTATVTTGIDYANTTVAFAVVWKPELKPDTVVVDYGLDVVIDVTTNDTLASGVTGVSTEAPGVAENSGTYANSVMAESDEIMIEDLIIGTVSKENLSSVRFSLNTSSGMRFNKPVKFYYESQCNYYTYTSSGDRTLNTDFMYSSVTVIPATSVYYEDDFIQFASFTKDTTGAYVKDDTCGWVTMAQNGVQDQDRPGASKISAILDADNNYGYDAAYENMSTFSMGSAAKFTVTADTRGEAYFSFYGTGFDVIGLTSNTTGTILVQVTDANGKVVKNTVVDTYYGYTKNADGEWVLTNEVAEGDADGNALYQVPVIKIFDLPYAKYSVKIMAVYNDTFNHTATEGSYDLYLDAIRIYDPTGNQDSTANDAYVEDGEGYPEYFEVRNQIISKNTYDSLNDASISGVVFIDGIGSGPSIADYKTYGPNNEVYLENGQAIAFDLSATAAAGEIAKVQLALKTIGGEASVKVYATDGTTALDADIATATDLYYDITALNGKTVVIMNDGDSGIVSITNVKVTYNAEQPVANEPEATMFMLRRSSVEAALATMSVEEEIPEEPTVPEEPTTPEEPEKPEKPEKPVKPVKPEKPEKPGKPGKPGKPDNSGKSGSDNSDNSENDSMIGKVIDEIGDVIGDFIGKIFG